MEEEEEEGQEEEEQYRATSRLRHLSLDKPAALVALLVLLEAEGPVPVQGVGVDGGRVCPPVWCFAAQLT